ncbi:hypothetical protein GF312_15170 [Candidatus Poribacteria bacterium]|nr:hypothetical protein [Candidatus Poribacteria bacterium]
MIIKTGKISLIFICTILLLVNSVVYSDKEKQGPAAAIVNNKPIPISDLDKEIKTAKSINPEFRNANDLATTRKLREKALDDLINKELMVQEGEKIGLEPKASRVDLELNRIKQRFDSQEAFEQRMKMEGINEEKLRETIRRALIVKEFIDTKIKTKANPVTDEDARNYYENHKEDFIIEQRVMARHILIKVPADASITDKNNAKKQMESILAEAKNGADFASLAKKYSQCPTGPEGGLLSYFTRGDMVKPFSDAAFALESGQISDVVETKYGYHIILVEDKKPEEQLTFEDVGDDIKEILTDIEVDSTLQDWLKSAREKAVIKKMM